jgi:hypothetical protein
MNNISYEIEKIKKLIDINDIPIQVKLLLVKLNIMKLTDIPEKDKCYLYEFLNDLTDHLLGLQKELNRRLNYLHDVSMRYLEKE